MHKHHSVCALLLATTLTACNPPVPKTEPPHYDHLATLPFVEGLPTQPGIATLKPPLPLSLPLLLG